MVGLVARGLRTIVFAKSRKACELVYRYARQGLLLNAPELAPRIAPYRAGYTPEQRREIETGLAEGRLLGVVATSALELGVDIGLLDCAISVGFPGGDGVAAAAVGPRRAARAGAGDAGGRRGPARPVLGESPRRAAGATGRGGRQQPRQPGGAGRAPALRGSRAAVDGGRLQPLRRRRAGAGRVACPISCAHRRGWPTAAADHPAARRCRCARPRRTRWRWSSARPARCWEWWTAPAPTRPSTRAPSTCTWASSTWSARSTPPPTWRW